MDTKENLAKRLTTGLDKLTARKSVATNTVDANVFAELAESLQQQLSAMPEDTRRLVHTADTGFASAGQWVDDAIEAQNKQIKKLARAASMVATWAGPDGEAAERTFVIRGNIRGWAHRWRKEDKGSAQVEGDPEFVSFASDCLTQAGIAGDHQTIIGKALGSDWRTAPI